MKIRTKITVDLTRPESIPMLHVKQGDSAREVEVTLCAGSSLVIPTTEEINIYIKKPDGTKVYNACSISDGKIIIPIKTQSVSCPGRGEAELQMVSGADIISTPIFSLDIMTTNIDDSAIESTNDFSALVQAIQDVNELKKNGIKGDPGRAATVDIGLVTTLEPGSYAFVSNSGTENDAVLNFGIPKGEKGDTGSVEVVTDAPVTYETPDTYEPPASGNIFRTWLGRVTKGLDNIISNIGTLASLTTTDKSSLVAAANELKLLADGKISLNKILTEEEWAAAISERGFLADAKDVKDSLEQLNTNLKPEKISVTNGYIIFIKQLNLVLFKFQSTGVSDLTIGKIPEGYRPSENIYITGISYNTSATNKYVADVIVWPSGVVNVTTDGAGRVRGCGWWVV